jgi:hypothetical protein
MHRLRILFASPQNQCVFSEVIVNEAAAKMRGADGFI